MSYPAATHILNISHKLWSIIIHNTDIDIKTLSKLAESLFPLRALIIPQLQTPDVQRIQQQIEFGNLKNIQ